MDIHSETLEKIDCFFPNNYQLHIASWLGVRPRVHILCSVEVPVWLEPLQVFQTLLQSFEFMCAPILLGLEGTVSVETEIIFGFSNLSLPGPFPIDSWALGTEGALIKTTRLVIFCCCSNKRSRKTSLGKKEFLWAHSLRIQCLVLGRARWQMHGAAGNTASALRKRRDEGFCPAYWVFYVWVPNNSMVPSPFGVWLPNSISWD